MLVKNMQLDICTKHEYYSSTKQINPPATKEQHFADLIN